MYDSNVRSTNVEAEGLGKRYGDLWALRDLDLSVPAGSVLGLLGHNGAGKTTTIRILATLTAPTEGRARVAGHDVVREPALVRASLGLAGQAAAVDGLMTVRANLEMIGRLYQLPRAVARRRAGELLERFGLDAAAGRLARELSGGQRRRLDLAATLVASPPVLFLDEPTVGLDPRARSELWELLGELVDGGVTLLLTTQYLEEADRLADQIVVLDQGRSVAAGTPSELKRRVGGDRIAVTVAAATQLAAAARALGAWADGEPLLEPGERRVTVPVRPGTRLVEVLRALDAAGVDAAEVHRREATLDDVFLSLTTDPLLEAA